MPNNQSAEDGSGPSRSQTRVTGQKRQQEPAPRDLYYPRKRALRACQLCRVRKTKCDNVQPTCGSCVTVGTTCRYDDLNDNSTFDPASLEILRKLGDLLTVQRDLVTAVRESLPDLTLRSVRGLSQSSAVETTTATAERGAQIASGSRIDAPVPSWNASQYSHAASYSNSYPTDIADDASLFPSDIPQDPSFIVSPVPMVSSDADSQSPVMSGSIATMRWFELLATDAAGAVMQTTEPNATLKAGLIHLIDYPNNDDITPLQRATKIVDDRQPDQQVIWTERLPTPSDNGASGRNPEERLWRADEDIRLLPHEDQYLENFVTSISKWIDLFDPLKPFSSLVPHLAIRNAGLMNAIFALSCRHLSLNPGICENPPDWNVALQYYYQTLHYVQKAMRYHTYQTSYELLATTLIVSTYEMLDGSRKAWERHLEGACWILRSQITEVESSDFKSAVWWAWLRQDVWAAFSEKRKTFTAWTPEKPYASLSAYELASRSVWIMAQIVNFCSRESHVAADSVFARRLQRAKELRRMLEEWRKHLSSEISPLSTTDDTVFEAIRVQPACLGPAVQLHHASRILLCANEPTIGDTESYLASQTVMQDSINIICGVGMTLQDDASSLISSQAVFIAGMFSREMKQRSFILELLESCRQRTGWSPRFCGQDLTQIWSQVQSDVL